MRTTIEIPESQRAKLVELAARRGEKGFSKLIQEALDAYLERERSQVELRRRALMVRGSFSDRDAEQVRKATLDIRGSWR